MRSKWIFFAQEIMKRMWFRATLYCLFAVAAALVGLLIDHFFPGIQVEIVSEKVVRELLNILTASMLAVTVFTLASMVAAYASASSNTTPRATRLLIEDANAQRALATFLGSFLFGIVGIIVVGSGLQRPVGNFTLFIASTIVIVLITVTLLKWIDQVSQLGRVGNTIDMVERSTRESLKQRAASIHLGGQSYKTLPRKVEMVRVSTEALGYVQYVDMGSLQNLAEKQKCRIFVNVLPGIYCSPANHLAFVDIPLNDDLVEGVRSAIVVGNSRTFSQDPRFGLIVLAEIAQRALSPALNDPGTAIDVIGTSLRLFAFWSQERKAHSQPEVVYPRVFVKELLEADMFDDIYGPIGRDGSSSFEVSMRLQKAFLALRSMNYEPYTKAAEHHARDLIRRNREKMLPLDRRDIEIAYRHW